MSSDRRTYHLQGRCFDDFKNLSWQSYFNCIEEPLIMFSDYYNLRRKSCASESGNISNSGQPHTWFINIVCACIYGINEEFSKEKITYLLCGLQILAAENCFEGFQDLEETKGGAAAMLLGVQWIDGQSSSWWRYTWRLWLAEFLWHVLPSTGLYSVFLWESRSPRCSKGTVGPEGVCSHASAQLCGRSAPPTSSPDPMFLFCLGSCCLLSLRTGETGSSGKCLNFSVWNGCHRCRCSVSTEGDPACQWGGVTRGKSCRSLKSLRTSMRSVGHLGSHHTPIHGKPLFLRLLSVPTLMYPGDCCFAVFVSRIFH